MVLPRTFESEKTIWPITKFDANALYQERLDADEELAGVFAQKEAEALAAIAKKRRELMAAIVLNIVVIVGLFALAFFGWPL